MYAKIKESIKNEDVKATQKLMDNLELKQLVREDKLSRNISSKDAAKEKQKQVLTFLENDNDNLTTNLKLMRSERQCLLQTTNANDITHLFGQGDGLDVELAREKRYIKDLEMQIRKESLELEQYRKKMKSTIVSDYLLLEMSKKADRNNDSMKSRIHLVQVQLSELTKENAELRKRVESHLKEKARFNQVFEELMSKLEKGKKVLKEVVEQAKTQFKKRDEVAHKVQALKGRDAADLKRRSEEMQDLEIKIVEDAALSRYRKRVAMVRQTFARSSTQASSKVHSQQIKDERRLERLHETWDRVKEVSGLFDDREVCDVITRSDAENFSLFNYNKELRYQVEALTEKTAELMRRIDEEQDFVYQREDERERKKSELQRLLYALEEQVSVESDEFQTNSRMFDRLLAKTKALFDMLKCDPLPLQQLLGDNDEVTEFNFQMYLGLVESRVMTLLAVLPRPVDITPNFSSRGFLLPTTSPIESRKNMASTSGKNLIEERKVVSRPCPDCEEVKRKPALL